MTRLSSQLGSKGTNGFRYLPTRMAISLCLPARSVSEGGPRLRFGLVLLLTLPAASAVSRHRADSRPPASAAKYFPRSPTGTSCAVHTRPAHRKSADPGERRDSSAVIVRPARATRLDPR